PRHVHRLAPIVHAAATARGLTPLNLVVWAKSKRRHGQSLPFPARVAAAFQERHHLTRQQHFPRQARTPSHELVDLSRSFLSWIRRPERSTRSSNCEANRHAAGRAIDLTNRGEIVLDPFLGSGSTLIAAQCAAW